MALRKRELSSEKNPWECYENFLFPAGNSDSRSKPNWEYSNFRDLLQGQTTQGLQVVFCWPITPVTTQQLLARDYLKTHTHTQETFSHLAASHFSNSESANLFHHTILMFADHAPNRLLEYDKAISWHLRFAVSYPWTSLSMNASVKKHHGCVLKYPLHTFLSHQLSYFRASWSLHNTEFSFFFHSWVCFVWSLCLMN